MEEELKSRLDLLEKKIDETYRSAEKTRRYILFIVIITLIALVLPLVGLVFAVPAMLASYGDLLTGTF